MASYTTTQTGSINNYPCVAYFAGVFLGVFSEEDCMFTFNMGYNKTGSSLTGVGAVNRNTTGVEECSFTATVRDYNKSRLVTAFEDIIQGITGGTSPNIGSPFTGAVEGVSDPKSLNNQALVIYPIFTDEEGIFGAAGTKYEDTTANPLAILIPKASIASNLEIALNPQNTSTYELKFEGVADVENRNRFFIQDDGIDTDGTYTP
jgi:hypothetical protein